MTARLPRCGFDTPRRTKARLLNHRLRDLCMLSIQWRFDGEAAASEDVGVDHGGFYVFVSEEFLNGADVVVVLQEVGCEGMTKGVRGDVFVNFCKPRSLFDGFLYDGFMQVMAAGNSSL